MKVLWTARRSNQPILKEISPDYSLELLILNLVLQYFDHLMQRIDSFALWYWRRLLRVPWIGRRSNQSILKEINPEYSLKGLKLQYFGHLRQRADSSEMTLMLGKIEGRGRGEEDDRG